jgi:rhodanese-related sulfurtransferase
MYQIEQVPAAGWQEWITRNNAVIVDVREPWEWQSTGVLPDSKLISLRDLPAALETLDRNTALLMVCRSGNRSQSAAEFLASAGFRQVANLRSGIMGVAAA